jgi:hypothetical protein
MVLLTVIIVHTTHRMVPLAINDGRNIVKAMVGLEEYS